MNAEACRRVRCGMASTKRYSRVGAQLGVHKRSAWMRGQTCRTCVAGLHTACNRHPSAVIALGGGGGCSGRYPRGPDATLLYRGGHRVSARSGDADDGEGVGEGAEVDSALPRRRHLVHDHGLLLGLGRLGLLELGASLGLQLVLDLERAELVAPSNYAVVLHKKEGAWSTRVVLALWGVGRSPGWERPRVVLACRVRWRGDCGGARFRPQACRAPTRL